MNKKISIAELNTSLVDAYVEHLCRHMKNSGIKNNIIYTPYEIGFEHNAIKIKENIEKGLEASLSSPNWQRIFVILSEEGLIVGHLNLKGDHLPTTLHRCLLGMGLNEEYRGLGYGTLLLQYAINWVTHHTTLAWIDLFTLTHNLAGIALYKKFGFKITGTVFDRFRIAEQKIHDHTMSLEINRSQLI